jgi:hypothetical protein
MGYYDKRIIYNAIQTPDGTILESNHRHDYMAYVDTIDGKEYMVDGGLDYLRRNSGNYIELSLYHDSDFTLVREKMKRFNVFTQKYVPLCEMSDEWITNIIDMFLNASDRILDHVNWYVLLLIQEKQYRIENEIAITENEEILAKANVLKEIISNRSRKGENQGNA